MEHDTIFKNYRSQLVREGILKSFLYGVVAFCSLTFVVALIVWLCSMKGGVWLALGLGLGGGIATGLVLYFLKFKPTAKDVARRVDALGLEERTVTMLDYSSDESYIAQRQREDAQRALKVASSKKLTISLSVTLIALVCVAPVLAAGMCTVTGLAESGVIPSIDEIANPERDKYFEVTYMVDGDGEIMGEDLQILLPGEEPTPVMAVAADGWEFVGWDDRLADPYRADTNITESTIYTAYFIQLDERDNPKPGDGDAPDGAEGDQDAQDPNGDSGMASGGEGDGNGSDPNEGNGSGDGGQDGSQDGSQGSGKGGGAGYQYEDKNQILDGNTYYKDKIEEYMRNLEEKLANNEELTDEEKRFIELYFGSL